MNDIFLFAIGLVVGAMNAVAGGGMLVGFPAFIATGLSAITANATGYLANLPGQLTSAIGYRKYLKNVPKKYALLLIPCALGAATGSLILRNTDSGSFEKLVPWLILLAIGLFAVQPILGDRLKRHLTKSARPKHSLLITGLWLFGLTIYGGYFGPGFGFVLLALLSFTRMNQLHQMNGLKNIASIAMGLSSIAVLYNGDFINWHAGLIMAAGSAIGGFVGSRAAQKVPSKVGRTLVIIIGVVAAAYLGLHKY